MPCVRSSRSSSSSSTSPVVSISLDDIKPHMKSLIFITGSFCIAWTFDLVAFGLSHVLHYENPMHEEIGFASIPFDGKKSKISPVHFPGLLLEYLLVCAFASYLSFAVQTHWNEYPWCAAALRAIEFFPAPYFSGKLMAFLGQFSHRLDRLEQGGLNLLATAFAAFLVHAFHDDSSWNQAWRTHPAVQQVRSCIPWPHQLYRFRHVLGDTLGFGLGVAWNVFFLTLLVAPLNTNTANLAGMFGYLMLTLLLAFKLAAMVTVEPSANENQQPSISLMQRWLAMLSFAFNVVCAFTTVSFLRTVLVSGWVGDFACLLLLFILAAIMSAVVASVKTSTTLTTSDCLSSSRNPLVETDLEQQPAYGFGSCCAADAMVFCPCVWCACPWLPLLWILAGMTPTIHVKEQWQQLIAFVLGLATSIQASGMITQALNTLAATSALGTVICTCRYCPWPWVFILLQILIALVTTAILLPLLGFVSDPVQAPLRTSESMDDNPARISRHGTGERRPLLQKIRRAFSRRSSSST